jgi:hypothetical protein
MQEKYTPKGDLKNTPKAQRKFIPPAASDRIIKNQFLKRSADELFSSRVFLTVRFLPDQDMRYERLLHISGQSLNSAEMST